MKSVLTLLTFIISIGVYAQPNCEILKADAACYQACKTSWAAIRYKQGSFKSQSLFDESIALCPSFAYAYQQKAVPYLKRGQFVEWKRLIDKAVELSPMEYLGYRGWCRIQFLRDYDGAITDIETLQNIMQGDIGFCQNGNYHLEIALGLCYKELGQFSRAKTIFENYFESSYYSEALYDFYHLGVIEYNLDNLVAAKENLLKQNEMNEVSESHFYLALIAKKEENTSAHSRHLDKAEQLYKRGASLIDNYSEPIDKIYLSDILGEKLIKED